MKFVRAFFAGGAERQFISLALALQSERIAVSFGCLKRWGHREFVDAVDAGGIPVFDYGVRTFRHPAVLRSHLRLARDIRRHQIRIVHTYGFPSHLFAIPAAKLAGARVVASILDLGVYLSPAQQVVQRLICRLADQIHVNAEAIRTWLIDSGYDGRRITVIPNGIDPNRFAERRSPGALHREFNLPAQAPLVGILGRVTRMKGLEEFLRAAAMVKSGFPEARYLVIGDALVMRDGTPGPDESYLGELRSLVTNLGLDDRVIFTGFRADLERLLGELSVSVSASLSEGFSNTVLESMCAGIPVVATAVGGTGEIIQDGSNGLLVPSGDPVSLAHAINRVLAGADLARQLGENARRSVAERYSWRRVVESTSEMYERLLDPTGRVGESAFTPDLNTKTGSLFHG